MHVNLRGFNLKEFSVSNNVEKAIPNLMQAGVETFSLSGAQHDEQSGLGYEILKLGMFYKLRGKTEQLLQS